MDTNELLYQIGPQDIEHLMVTNKERWCGEK